MNKVVIPEYIKAKRDEMTFGYLKDFVHENLVPFHGGSVGFYEPKEVASLMTEMDAGFVGLRRSTIDKLENVRQIILYTVLAKEVDGKVVVGVYQRAAGSEAKLKGGYSFGFGGHVETQDVRAHETDDMTHAGTVSSFLSTMDSGDREVTEEVTLTGDGVENWNIVPVGFLSDLREHQPGWIGNTHIAVIGVVVLPPDTDFTVNESNYTTIGWMNQEDLTDVHSYLEPWSKILFDRFPDLEEVIRANM